MIFLADRSPTPRVVLRLFSLTARRIILRPDLSDRAPAAPAPRTALLVLSLLAASPAQASMFSGDTLDAVADGIAWFVLAVVPALVIALFWIVHVMPEKIAYKRHHPQAQAIHTLCLLSLVFGGLLWPLAWLWAYTKPTAYRLAYGTDKAASYHLAMAELAAEGKLSEAELAHLRAELDAMHKRGALPPELGGLRERLDAPAARGPAGGGNRLMDALILGLYAFFVWLIFFKFKWLPWNTTSMVIVITIPVVALTLMILLLNVFAPSSADVRVIKPVVNVVPQVGGRVLEVPVEPNRLVKKGEVLFKIDPTPYELAVKGLEAQLANAEATLARARRAAGRRRRRLAAARGSVQQADARVREVQAKLELHAQAGRGQPRAGAPRRR